MFNDDYKYYAVTFIAYNIHNNNISISTLPARISCCDSKHERESTLLEYLSKTAKTQYPEQHFYGHKVFISEMTEESFKNI